MISKYQLFSGSVACLYRAIQKIERVEMARFGLKGPHAQCLLAISSHPKGLTAAQLCQLCEKDKAAISRIVSELEQAGLLRRGTPGSARYRAPLTLTEQGQEAAAQVNARAQQAVEQAGAGLTDAQREVFYQVLATIAGNLHTICREGLPD